MRLSEWVIRFRKLSPERQTRELARMQFESFLPARHTYLRYHDPVTIEASVADSLDSESPAAESGRVMVLVEFIRQEFGKRCAAAALAIMEGASRAEEIGVLMGISRQSAALHLRKIQSRKVKRMAVKLGLVQRESALALAR